MSGSDRIRVLLVDDHTLLRQSLRQVLSIEPDLDVIGEAGDADQAVALAAQARPDVILLDVEMHGADPMEVLARIHAAAPTSQVMVLSMHDHPAVVRGLVALGARGYLLKNISRQQLVAAIRNVWDNRGGHVVLSVSYETLTQLSEQGATTLSSREKEILILASQAMTNAQIATRLEIAEGTVKRHLRNIFEKLRAVSRIDAVNKAVSSSIITLPGQRAAGYQPRPAADDPSRRIIDRPVRRQEH
jgi:DNA-binding NarL/FixJ family response regulator